MGAGGGSSGDAGSSGVGAGPGSGGTGGAVPVADPVGALRVSFTDVTAQAGITHVQSMRPPGGCVGKSQECTHSLTGGAAAADYDGDGNVDLFVTRDDATDILYRNRGDGTFEDVSAAAGFFFDVPTNGAAWGDVDNDGDPDLYVTTVWHDRFYLWINQGDGTFLEEALERGAALRSPYPHYGFSAAFGDYDRDGFLDIHTNEWVVVERDLGQTHKHGRLLRNLGAANPGNFEDVTEAAGLIQDVGFNKGVFGFVSTFADLDDNGFPDLAVTADYKTSQLYWNAGDGTFIRGTTAAGVGTDENGMGSAIGDIDGDGRDDWFITSIYCVLPECLIENGNRLFSNSGGRTFTDVTDARAVRDGGWGWGSAAFDYDNDGDLDIVMTSGVVFADGSFEFAGEQPMRLWENVMPGGMPEVAQRVGLTDTGDGKGVTVFDYDNDGDLDVFVTRHGQTPVLYRNDRGNDFDWLKVKLVGTQSNRFGVGSRVVVRPGGGAPEQSREVRCGGQFLGQNDVVEHFGLGENASTVAEVVVTWPGGAVQTVSNVDAKTLVEIVEQ